MRLTTIALLLSLLPPALQAEEPTAGAARSIVTTPAGLTDPGVLQLELGGSQAFARDSSREGSIKAQIDLGLTSWLDLRCGWSGHAWWQDAEGKHEEGSGDPYIGGQALFVGQPRAGVDIGLAYSHLIPRASVQKGLSSGYAEDTLLLTVSRSFGRWSLDANAGVNRARKLNRKMGSLAVTYAPAQGWNLTLDNYAVAKSKLGDRELGSILAASYDVNDQLRVDMSLERGWADESPRYALQAGLICRLGKLW